MSCRKQASIRRRSPARCIRLRRRHETSRHVLAALPIPSTQLKSASASRSFDLVQLSADRLRTMAAEPALRMLRRVNQKRFDLVSCPWRVIHRRSGPQPRFVSAMELFAFEATNSRCPSAPETNRDDFHLGRPSKIASAESGPAPRHIDVRLSCDARAGEKGRWAQCIDPPRHIG